MQRQDIRHLAGVEQPVGPGVQAVREHFGVAGLACSLQGLSIVLARASIVATGPEHTEVEQSVPLAVTIPGGAGEAEGGFQPFATFGKIAAGIPESPQDGAETEGFLNLVALKEPCQGCAQVVVLGLKPQQPC